MDTFEAANADQQAKAAQRVADAAETRHDTEVTLAKGDIALADTPERVAARLDRLSRYHGEVQPVDPTALAEQDPTAVEDASRMLERIIGSEDYVHVRYLDAGVVAARAVGRISIRDVRGRVVGFGTGSLVSTQLLLTNHHVLTDAAVAGRSVVEFDFQDGLDGLPLATVTLGLDPDRLFLAHEDLDYALVAVKATPEELARFGWNPVIEAEGKAILGDFVTIVQHPSGEKKRVALRDNQVVGLPGDFMHYRADTKPGSSGSPVFNDQWEVVALHHAASRPRATRASSSTRASASAGSWPTPGARPPTSRRRRRPWSRRCWRSPPTSGPRSPPPRSSPRPRPRRPRRRSAPRRPWRRVPPRSAAAPADSTTARAHRGTVAAGRPGRPAAERPRSECEPPSQPCRRCRAGRAPQPGRSMGLPGDPGPLAPTRKSRSAPVSACCMCSMYRRCQPRSGDANAPATVGAGVRRVGSSSGTFSCSRRCGTSSTIGSPSWMSASRPPAAASGAT